MERRLNSHNPRVELLGKSVMNGMSLLLFSLINPQLTMDPLDPARNG